MVIQPYGLFVEMLKACILFFAVYNISLCKIADNFGKCLVSFVNETPGANPIKLFTP